MDSVATFKRVYIVMDGRDCGRPVAVLETREKACTYFLTMCDCYGDSAAEMENIADELARGNDDISSLHDIPYGYIEHTTLYVED